MVLLIYDWIIEWWIVETRIIKYLIIGNTTVKELQNSSKSSHTKKSRAIFSKSNWTNSETKFRDLGFLDEKLLMVYKSVENYRYQDDSTACFELGRYEIFETDFEIWNNGRLIELLNKQW